MKRYEKKDVKELSNEKGYYLPKSLFESGKYKNLRVEVKFAYCALLNTLIKKPSYDKEGKAFIKTDNPSSVEALKDLANKEVDQAKMNGYIDELNKADLIEIESKNIYFGDL
ncbi:MAG: hypothetical protein PHH04_05215 [Thomasclavelia sp.]|nr:hypothetical protein [Thomasclavelia sp.]